MSIAPRRRRGRGGQGGYESPARIRARELRATDLSVRGWSQSQIAADLGVSQAAVSKILRRVDERALREVRANADRLKVQHARRLDHVCAESMRAWDDSKSDATRRRQRNTQGSAGGAGHTVAEIVSENQHGNPRYLEVFLKALTDRSKLWGLDAPQKVDVRASRNPYDDMTEDALREEVAKGARLLEAETPSTNGPSTPTDALPARGPEDHEHDDED